MNKACILILSLVAVSCAAAQPVVIRNSYDMPYAGPVAFKTSLPDGHYAGKDAAGSVKSGRGYFSVQLPAKGQVTLESVATRVQPSLPDPKMWPNIYGDRISIRDAQERVTTELGFCLIAGRTGTADEAVSSFRPISISTEKNAPESLSGTVEVKGYRIKLNMTWTGGNWTDWEVEMTNVSAGTDAAYVALVRRVRSPGVSDLKMRWNGKIVSGIQPLGYNNYCHGLDWCSWKASDFSFVVANGFTPGPSIETAPGKWSNAGHPYVWQHVRQQDDTLYFISELAGPDPAQKPGYKGIKAYVQPLKGEPVKVRWRLAISSSPKSGWAESQFLGSSGYRKARTESGKTVVDLGVPYVEFGTSYFPYSTMTENFDYYRVRGLDREGWWPFSPEMWSHWRAFAPQMRTDLRIIKAMGFDWVRMHHLELLASMDRADAMEFIDFYMKECRTLGLKVLIDTSGTPQWFARLAGSFRDVVKRIEIENEVLIPGIAPGAPERWRACYDAAKKAAPDTEVFLTGNANLGMFDRLDRLGVPYDRFGYHTYKHHEGGEEALSSLAAAVAGVASEHGKTPILSEFNWKFLTRMSPEARAKEWTKIFTSILASRAVPEFLQFHWQETMSVNPLLCRQGLRHYETIYLDRRPKPEAIEFMKLIRKECRPDSPVRELPIKVNNTTFKNAVATARFTVTNATKKTLTIKLTPECFGGARSVLTASAMTLNPGEYAEAQARLALPKDARPGVYHFFVRADYGGKASYGWGYACKVGMPAVDKTPVLPDLVEYHQPSWVNKVVTAAETVAAAKNAQCVAFGPDCPIVEMEMAYVVANTLMSATGREIRLCSTADIPKDLRNDGILILVGTPQSNPLIGSVADQPTLPVGKGVVVAARHAGTGILYPWLLITGDSSKSVEAAATDFVLRYWKNARDSAIRITGMEKGAALGNKAAPGQVNPP